MSSDNDNTALVTAVLFSIAVIAVGSLSTGHHPVDVLLIIVGKVTWYGFLMVVFGIPALYLGWNILIAAKHYYGDVKRTHKTDDESPAAWTDMLSKFTEKAKDLLKRTAPPDEQDASQESQIADRQEHDEYEEITAYEDNGEEEDDDDEDEEEDDDDEYDENEEDDEEEDEEDESDDFEDSIFRRN